MNHKDKVRSTLATAEASNALTVEASRVNSLLPCPLAGGTQTVYGNSAAVAAVRQLEAALAGMKARAEQAETQLAGCATAAGGAVADLEVARRGDYGWSPSYQDVVDLRRKHDVLEMKMSTAAPAGTIAAVEKRGEAKGIQIAREYLASYAIGKPLPKEIVERWREGILKSLDEFASLYS